MARKNSTADFKDLLYQFSTETDPLLEMLKWVTDRMLRIEAEQKVSANKGQHSKQKETYFLGIVSGDSTLDFATCIWLFRN